MLPSVAKLRLDQGRRRGPVSTDEFYPLNSAQVAQLNAEGEQEAFTTERFQEDADPVEGWHTFRVRAEHPRADGTYAYKYYRAESLWEYVKRGNRFDPLTRGPIWYEDYVELHSRFAPGEPIPGWATQQLRRRDAPPPAAAPEPAVQAPIPPHRQNAQMDEDETRLWIIYTENGEEMPHYVAINVVDDDQVPRYVSLGGGE